MADAELTGKIRAIHAMTRRSYGSPRVWSELRLGEGVRCYPKRVERLMRLAGIQGLHRRKFRGCTRRDPAAMPSEDLVNRHFTVEGPDRLWVSDITEHATAEGKVYVAMVLDAWSRRVVGWSIADHIGPSWWSTPCNGGLAAGDRRKARSSVIPIRAVNQAQGLVGRRLQAAGVLGSMGSIGDAYDCDDPGVLFRSA